VPYNRPLMVCAGKIAAPLAAGNAVVMREVNAVEYT
jgi:acyl-CoA reductase-like NAD-dependent aldehyde dehydrogenase